MIKTLIGYFEWVERVSFELGKIILALMMLLITADAMGRYFLNHPITGARQIVSELFMVALVYLTLSYIFRQDGHVRLTLISKKLSAPVRRFLLAFFDVLSFIFWSMIAYQYFFRALKKYPAIFYPTLGFQIPKFFPFLFVMIGTLLLSVRILIHFFEQLPFSRSSSSTTMGSGDSIG